MRQSKVTFGGKLLVLIFFALRNVAADSGVDGVFLLIPNESTAVMFAPAEGHLSISISSIIGLFDVTVLPESQYYLMAAGDPYYDYPIISESYVQSYSWTGPFVGDEYYNWIVIETKEDNMTDIWVSIEWYDDCIFGNDSTTGIRPPRTEPVFITKAVYPTRAYSSHIEKICSTQTTPDCPPPTSCSGHVAISLSAVGLWFLTILIAVTYYFLYKRKEIRLDSASPHRGEIALVGSPL